MQESDFNEDDLPQVDELTALKARADQMGLTYHPSIGLDKLRAKVTAALEGTAQPGEEEEAEAPVAKADEPKEKTGKVEESPHEFRSRKKREASELLRIRVTCMNPNKKEWEGEIFTAGNSLVGTFKKYVPFDADDGWHVPRMIYNQIIQRQCQVFVTKKGPRGIDSRQGKLIREFAVEILPPLTKEELHDLAQRQAMAKSVG